MAGGKFFPAVFLAPLLVLAVLAACGGGGDSETVRPGQLTDPRSVPTAAPWRPGEEPEVIILEPGALTPLGTVEAEEAEAGDAEEGGEAMPVDCGETYTVEEGDVPSTIAEKCGVDLQDLLDANPEIEPTNLHIGDVLNIPQ